LVTSAATTLSQPLRPIDWVRMHTHTNHRGKTRHRDKAPGKTKREEIEGVATSDEHPFGPA
jgi:hypothetical protein